MQAQVIYWWCLAIGSTCVVGFGSQPSGLEQPSSHHSRNKLNISADTLKRSLKTFLFSRYYCIYCNAGWVNINTLYKFTRYVTGRFHSCHLTTATLLLQYLITKQHCWTTRHDKHLGYRYTCNEIYSTHSICNKYDYKWFMHWASLWGRPQHWCMKGGMHHCR